MTTVSPPKTLTVALVGNPNTGKSTLFNALVGARQRVGNYPGVTVERKTGKAQWHGQSFLFVDLPGTYSLAPRSPDEMVTVDVLLHRRADTPPVDAVLCIVDASNLERNFYIVSQLLELGLPTVIALNMTDIAQAKGVSINLGKLREKLPVPVIPVQANRGGGLEELRAALAAAAESEPAAIDSPFPKGFQAEVAALEAEVAGERKLPRFLVERLLLDSSGYLAGSDLPGVTPGLLNEVKAARGRLATAGTPVPAVEAMARYGWAAKLLSGAVERKPVIGNSFSDRVDRVLTHWLTGTLVFVLVMIAMFQAVSWITGPAGMVTDFLTDHAKALVEMFTSDGALRSLLQTGVIDGVGGVLGFLPQIGALFLFIAILEDCGYMARAAYLMDRVMSQVGLSGKSFIPLLSSFACAIPGVMGARVIENRRDRLVTMLIAPLMSCSARLPVYMLMATVFLPDWKFLGGLLDMSTLAIVGMYFLGIAVAMVVALILKRTLLRGATPAFVMELPTYKWPQGWTVFQRVYEQLTAFVVRAGTLILAISVVIWALAYYPRDERIIPSHVARKQAELQNRFAVLPSGDDVSPQVAEERELLAADMAPLNNQIAAAHLKNSYLGRAGRFIEPVVKPLGWDWRIGCAAIASFPAREVIIATLGVIYGLGDGEDENSDSLRETLKSATWEGTDRPVFNAPVALSVMVFFALCAQCSSTLAVIQKETGSWQWTVFTFGYMTALAYVGAFLTYQIGMWLSS